LNEVIKDPVYKKFIQDEINRLGVENKLSSLEKPKDIALTLDAFTIENNLLTPTFKLKRNVGREVFKAQIDKMYEGLVKLGL
jgi:long-chain acyl-CoA synthetase